jgi:hypothetical protein
MVAASGRVVALVRRLRVHGVVGRMAGRAAARRGVARAARAARRRLGRGIVRVHIVHGREADAVNARVIVVRDRLARLEALEAGEGTSCGLEVLDAAGHALHDVLEPWSRVGLFSCGFLTFCSTTFHFSPVLCASGCQISLRMLMYSLAMRCIFLASQSSAFLDAMRRSCLLRQALADLSLPVFSSSHSWMSFQFLPEARSCSRSLSSCVLHAVEAARCWAGSVELTAGMWVEGGMVRDVTA